MLFHWFSFTIKTLLRALWPLQHWLELKFTRMTGTACFLNSAPTSFSLWLSSVVWRRSSAQVAMAFATIPQRKWQHRRESSSYTIRPGLRFQSTRRGENCSRREGKNTRLLSTTQELQRERTMKATMSEKASSKKRGLNWHTVQAFYFCSK